MINAQMREYDYSTFGVKDAYGQEVPSTTKAGSVKMAINIASQSVQDNSLYKMCIRDRRYWDYYNGNQRIYEKAYSDPSKPFRKCVDCHYSSPNNALDEEMCIRDRTSRSQR